MTQEELEKLKEKARIAKEREAAEKDIASVQPAWRIKEQQSHDDYYGRVNRAHERAMESRRARMAASPGSFSPQAKAAVENYYAEKAKEDQRNKDNEYRENELGTKRHIAEQEAQGKIGAGRDAAQISADAERYKSDNALKGIEAQARSQQEMDKARLEFEKWKSGEGFRHADEANKREHGYWDENGGYHPGSKERSAEAAGEARMTMEKQRQEGRKELEKIKGENRLNESQAKGLREVAREILKKDGKYRMQDTEAQAKRLGISVETIRSYFKNLGIEQDEEPETAPPQTAMTPRQAAMRINRFA